MDLDTLDTYFLDSEDLEKLDELEAMFDMDLNGEELMENIMKTFDINREELDYILEEFDFDINDLNLMLESDE